MKRNSATKKLFCFLMSLLMIAGIVPMGAIETLAADLGEWIYTVPEINHVKEITWKNDGSTIYKDTALKKIVLHCANNRLAYCVIPGVAFTTPSTGEFSSFTDGAFENKTKGVLSNIEIEKLIKLVLAYGCPTGFLEQEVVGETFYKAFATQLLIWEVVTGERLSDFSHNGDLYYALAFISTNSKSYKQEGSVYYKAIKDKYDEIVKNVRADIHAHEELNKAHPAEDVPNINLGTLELELKLNEGKYCYEGEIKNSNLKNCIKDNLKLLGVKSENGENISIDANNSKIKDYMSIDATNGTIRVSIPIEKAFDFRKTIYSFEATKNEPYIKEHVKYKDTSKMTLTIYKSAQQMVAMGGEVNGYEADIIGSHNYYIDFKIKVPDVHRHKWIPHKINPTCTTEGLMCWQCSCGRIVTADYGFVSGSGPKDFNYKDGIVPAEGHDSGVTVTTIEPTCESKGEEQTVCTKCGIIIGSREISALGHTKEGEGSVWVVSHEPTSESKGEKRLVCGKCSAVQKTEEIHQHTHDSDGGEVVVTPATCSTAGIKGTLCSACGAVYNTMEIPASHSRTVEVTNVPASCKADGEANVLCSDCGEVLSVKVLPALGHTEDDVWFTAVEPTCTTSGELQKICTRCGEVTDSKKESALGHDGGAWEKTLEPTCELDGERVLTCTRCGKIEKSEKIPALGHDEGTWKIDVEATADHDGSMNLHCTRCGMVEETRSFKLHTHKAGYEATLLKATCTHDGEKGTVCSLCNAIFETEKIPAFGHSYLPIFKNGNGTHSMKCENCGYVYTENCSFKATVRENSCVSIGYSVYTCDDCGYSYTDGYTEAKGHNYAKWENYNAASHVRYCSRCPVAEYTLHVWSPYYHNGDNTSIDPGTKTKTCIYCGCDHTVKADESCIVKINVAVNNGAKKALSFIEFIQILLEAAQRILRAIGIMK